jgi:hypothetical protein
MLSRNVISLHSRAAAASLVILGLVGIPAPTVAPLDSQYSSATTGSGHAIGDESRLSAAYGNVPLSFEPNQGQADPSVDFVAHGQGYTLLLSEGDITLAPQIHAHRPTAPAGPPDVLRVRLLDADPHPAAAGVDMLPGTANYFVGADPADWHTAIATYARVQYQQVYPGIDLIYYGNQGHLEDDFVLAPGADPRLIRVRFDGAEQVQLDDTGELIVQVAGGRVRQAAPIMYQDGPAGQEAVAGGYTIDDQGQIGFEVGAYDTARPLVIDPVLVYSTYFGGIGPDQGLGIAIDGGGNAYITGSTSSADLATTSGAFQRTIGDTTDAFVAKLNATGTALVYSTYLGGSVSADNGLGVALDVSGNAYVTGFTSSANFPTTPGAFQRTFVGREDAFVSKLNATGTALVYSTYLGASNGAVAARAIALDTLGNAYVTGFTDSANFPTTPGAFSRMFGGTEDAFVSKLNATGTALLYSTYLGGGTNSVNQGLGIALDGGGSAYITGFTNSGNFPTTSGAFQRTIGGGFEDAFVTRLNATGTALAYSTYLGGSSGDEGFAIALDRGGNAYVTGFTESANFPTTPGAFRRTFGGSEDAFVIKLNATGTALAYSTYLGGGQGFGIAVDSSGNAYVTGLTQSSDYPTTLGALKRKSEEALPAFVSKLNATGTGLVYSTTLGGSGRSDQGRGVAVGLAGNAYVTGVTFSDDFPTTTGAFQPTLRGIECGGPEGCSDAFVARIASAPPVCAVTALISGPPAQLKVAVHADRGLSSLLVTQATNTSIALPSFTAGSTGTFTVTATKVVETAKSTFALRVSDQTGATTDCDPAVVTIGRERGESPVHIIHHVANAESHLTMVNGAPGIDRLRIRVNGHQFEQSNLQDGQTDTVDLHSALREGMDNTVQLVAHGLPGSHAVVVISD